MTVANAYVLAELRRKANDVADAAFDLMSALAGNENGQTILDNVDAYKATLRDAIAYLDKARAEIKP